jgi:ketosteroid isomerase-like protein
VSNSQAVEAYFDAIRARDADALARLFSSDADLVTAAGTFHGRDAIASFYRDLAFTVDDLWPETGPFSVEDDHVAVAIRLRMNGDVSLVNDFFTLGDGLITRLVIEAAAPGK